MGGASTSLPKRGMGNLSGVDPKKKSHQQFSTQHSQWHHCHRKHGVAHGVHCISYIHVCKATLYVVAFEKVQHVVLISDIHSTWDCVSETSRAHFITHAKLTLGQVHVQVNFDHIQEIGHKVGGGRSFEGDYSFADYGRLTGLHQTIQFSQPDILFPLLHSPLLPPLLSIKK